MLLYLKFYIIFLSCFFICTPIMGQTKKDTLEQKTFMELILLYNADKNRTNREAYVKTILKKAKAEENIPELITGYHIYALFSKDEKRLIYCDSIIDLSKNKSDILYPATAYQIKGSYYYKKRNLKEALDNYNKANIFAKKHNNQDILFSCNYSIGALKSHIGEYDEALKIFQKIRVYAKDNLRNGKSSYLNSIYALADTFNNLKQLDSAFFYNELGVKESLKLKMERYYHHFSLNQGTTQYYLQNFMVAKDSIEKHTPYFVKTNNQHYLAMGYFYNGKVYQGLNNIEKAIEFYKRVDTVFQKTNDIDPKIRESYEHLINYYKEHNDYTNQLNYIEQLMKVDSVLYNNKVYLNKHIIKEYDVPKLLSEKERIIIQLEESKKKSLVLRGILLMTLLLIIAISIYQYNLKKTYKKKFLEIINNKDSKVKFKKINRTTTKLNDEVVNTILLELENFEKSEEYISAQINLQTLSKKLNTNSNYLSKIINTHKNISFTNYLNELRVTHAINQFKSNPVFRKYTIKAIANEVGFNNAESFSKAFYRIKGIKPSFFIKEFKKINRNS